MAQSYTFAELVAIARRVMRAFDAAEQRPWTIEASMIELMKQTGDLARHVMMAERYYLPDRAQAPEYATTTADIGDELADILYCVMRIAEHYQIDLEQAHLAARRNELRSLGAGARLLSARVAILSATDHLCVWAPTARTLRTGRTPLASDRGLPLPSHK